MQSASEDKRKTTRKPVSPPVEEEDDGAAGFFLTEEAVRKALGESVPRDLMDFILSQSERTRAEILDRISKEFARALESIDPVELAKRLLEGHSIEVSARFRLVPSDSEEDAGAIKRSKKRRGRAG